MKKIVILYTLLNLLHSTSTFGQLTVPPNITTTTSSLAQYPSIQFNEGGLLTISQSTPGLFVGNISGPGALTIEGGGDITLTGNNTYTDLTTISDTSSLIVSVTTKGVTTIGSIPPTGSVALGSESSSLTFNIPFGSPGTFSGNISGAGALNLEGGGTLTLSGSNTYTGGTTLQGQSTLEGTTETLPSTSPIVLNGSSSVNFNQQTPGKSGTYAQAITGTGAVFIEEGYITLTGSNTYTGGTTIDNGCQLIGSIGTDTHPGSLPSGGSFMLEGGSSSIVFNQSLGGQPIDGTYSGNFQGSGNVLIEGGGTVTFTGKNNSDGAEITINSSESTLIGSAGTSTTLGSLTSSITNFGTLIFNQPGSTTSTPISYVFSGNISNKGDVTVEGGGGGEEDTGLFTLDFIGNNSYTGITTLNTSKGRLQGNIPSSSTWNLAVEGATYDLNGANQSIGGLEGVTGSIVNLGANTLTIGNNNTSTTFSGTIQDAGLGGSLIKVGTGNLTLAQTPNYTGTTEISNGTFTG